MNGFFGNNSCGGGCGNDFDRGCGGNGRLGCGCGNNCWIIILLLLCGGCGNDFGRGCDCCTLILLILLLCSCCGDNKNC